MKNARLIVGIVLGAAAMTWTAGCAGEAELTPARQAAIIDSLSPSLVRVEYTLQYDKGEPPLVGARSGEALIMQERPLEMVGYCLSPKSVLTADVFVHPRFVKSIAVRSGKGGVVPAHISAYGLRESVLFLELDEPLPSAVPLDFSLPTSPPYFYVSYTATDAQWESRIRAMPTTVAVRDNGERYAPVPTNCVIVDGKGRVAALSMLGKSPPDESWKGSPQVWPTATAAEMSSMLADLEKRAGQCLLRVRLSFRSPKKSQQSVYSRSRDEEDDEGTERDVPGVLIDAKRVLVVTNLDAKVTARLERIVVHPVGGESVRADFAGTLNDYGAFVANLEKPLEGWANLSDAKVVGFDDKLLLTVQLLLQGEKRITYYDRARATGFEFGWRRQIYPAGTGRAANEFYFTPDGRLVALPLARRLKIAGDRNWQEGLQLTAAEYVKGVLADLPANLDTSNVPVSEEQENRLAWLGVELQGLNKELARINNVSDLTRDGRMGALVSYVYDGSPAAAAGVKPGWVLLRLHVEGQPKPLEVRIEDFGFGINRAFPWEQLDQVPDQYFDQIPIPWPSADNTINRQLTEFGFGKKFKAEFFADGEVVTKDFTVVEGPPYYDSAARQKSEPLGLIVRDLTYEVRRYFQKGPEDSGVIVSKIEPGSKAAVSGIKPYEIITAVNDKPVANADQFAKLIAAQDELRLEVKRMNKGRVVKIKMTADKPARSTSQASQAAASGPAATAPAHPAPPPAVESEETPAPTPEPPPTEQE